MKLILLFILALRTSHLEIGGKSLTVEIAETAESLSDGLKGRKHLPTDHGMLFIFKTPGILSFWMKDTLVPLSIGFFDQDRILINIEDMFPPIPGEKSLPLFKSRASAKYALEVPLNWYRDHEVFPGMKFSFQDHSSSDKMVKHE